MLKHDAYNAQTFAQATNDFGGLGRTVEESGTTLCTAPALMRDLFASPKLGKERFSENFLS